MNAQKITPWAVTIALAILAVQLSAHCADFSSAARSRAGVALPMVRTVDGTVIWMESPDSGVWHKSPGHGAARRLYPAGPGATPAALGLAADVLNFRADRASKLLPAGEHIHAALVLYGLQAVRAGPAPAYH